MAGKFRARIPNLWTDVLLLGACALLPGSGWGLVRVSEDDGIVRVLWMAPSNSVMDGNRTICNASTSVGCLANAIERVQREGLLQERQIQVTWLDSHCDPQESVGKLVDYLYNSTPSLIIGPPCSEAMIPVADIGSYFDIPVFSWITNEHSLDNKTRASTLVRTLPPLSSLGNLLLGVCERFNWFRLAIISTKGRLSEGVSDFLIAIIEERQKFTLAKHYSRINESLSQSVIKTMFTEIRKVARIIILVLPDNEVRTYLLAAHDVGMTSGDFQFLFARQMIADGNFAGQLRSDSLWRLNDGRDDDARQAFENLLYFTYSYVLEWNIDYSHLQNATLHVFGNDSNMPPYLQHCKIAADTRIAPDRYCRFLNDAFYLYCLANNSTRSNNSQPTGRNIFKTAPTITFSDGMTGFVHISLNGDRQPTYLVWDMIPNKTFQVVMHVTYGFNDKDIPNITYENNRLEIYWGNGLKFSDDHYTPQDTPICGFDNEFCPEDTSIAIIVPTVLTAGMLAGVLVFFIWYRWWKREKELHNKSWRVKWADLNFDLRKVNASQVLSDKRTPSRSSFNSDMEPNASTANASLNSSVVNREFLGQSFCKSAILNNSRVAVRPIRKKSIRNDRKLLEEMYLLTNLKCPNIAQFCGVCMDPPNLCVLWEYCSKGSIQDVINNNDIRLDSIFKFSLAFDIISGLMFIHESGLKVHGNLRSSNCLVDSRWSCKLSGFGLRNLLKGEQPEEDVDEQSQYAKLYWTAPESLRCILKGEKYACSQPADIYAVAIIFKEIMCKNEPYEEEHHVQNMTPKEIISKVAELEGDTLFRPNISELPEDHQSVFKNFMNLIHACWQEDPNLRPSSRRIQRHLKRLNPFKTTNIMDNMVKMMERYSLRLEDIVAERTSQLEEEKRKTDALLFRMLPQKVAEELKRGQHVQAEAFSSVTIYFSDIVGFTTIASESTPMQIVEFLNKLYTVFDDVIQSFDVYKVETIGDAYMVVSGVPIPNGNRHVTIMADMSLTLLQRVTNFTVPHMPDRQLRIRIGLNTGPVVAAVVGSVMPRYCLFGDTVNLASRMESHGVPLKIQMSPFTYAAMEEKEKYVITPRGEVEIKGKGIMCTYFLEGKVDEGDPTKLQTCSDKDTEEPITFQVQNHKESDINVSAEKYQPNQIPSISLSLDNHVNTKEGQSFSSKNEVKDRINFGGNSSTVYTTVTPITSDRNMTTHM